MNGDGGSGVMEIFSKEVQSGSLRIELSVREGAGCSVICTAKDEENRIVWRTPLTDAEGHVLIYQTLKEAIQDAAEKLKLNF
jgi:hypothetical protein